MVACSPERPPALMFAFGAGALLFVMSHALLSSAHPPPLQLNGATFVTLTLQGNKFNVSSSPLAAGAGSSGGSFSTDLTGLIVEGTVLSNSSFTGVETLSMVGINATNTSAATVTTQVGVWDLGRHAECTAVCSSCTACAMPACGQACGCSAAGGELCLESGIWDSSDPSVHPCCRATPSRCRCRSTGSCAPCTETPKLERVFLCTTFPGRLWRRWATGGAVACMSGTLTRDRDTLQLFGSGWCLCMLGHADQLLLCTTQFAATPILCCITSLSNLLLTHAGNVWLPRRLWPQRPLCLHARRHCRLCLRVRLGGACL